MQIISDAVLMAQVQSGNRASFGILYDRYVRDIYRFVYYKTHHKQTAEDITSQVFIKALDKAATFTDTKGNVRGWLYRIARNTIIDHYRAARPTRDIEDAWNLAYDGDIEDEIDLRAKIDLVKEYLAALSADQRDIIILKLWQELSYEEIALALQKSEASCKMGYSRGIKKLKRIMPASVFIFFLMF